MQNSVATLHCSNPRCQAVNSKNDSSCHQCQTPLVKRYLWAMGEGIKTYKPGTLLADRYQVVQSSLVLDTKPAQSPQFSSEIPPNLLPYLKLSPYRLHIPQIYGQFSLNKDGAESSVWLLEYGSLKLQGNKQGSGGKCLAAITQVWQDATAIRQLNWLWQIAQLWQPLQTQGVASSLLKPSLVRVSGSVVQLLELQRDLPSKSQDISLKSLGKLWLEWAAGASPEIRPWLTQLCEQLLQGEVKQAEVLVGLLDQGLAKFGHSQVRNFAIAARTDKGRTRKHNEDACYPPDETFLDFSATNNLAVVCDGIGGHEGGEIASQLAIETLSDGVVSKDWTKEEMSPEDITESLEQLVYTANNVISERNDLEKRSDRRRMGTTLVMTLARAHEMYFSHVGDSRIYWITRNGCYQLTLDDDLASREVRLGYAFYRDAIQYPNSGALVQALGMGSSTSLHPTVQRLILDEDSLFLLCSDGLSDFDRVEQYWEDTLLPILEQNTTVETAVQQLIEIANTRNGHDNITVALVHCQVQANAEPVMLSATPEPLDLPSQVIPSQMKTQEVDPPIPAKKAKSFVALIFLGALLILGVGVGVSLYLSSPEARDRLNTRSPQSSPPPTEETPQTLLPAPGTVLELQQPTEIQSSLENSEEWLDLPEGSIIQILDQLTETSSTTERTWLRLEVCTLPNLPLGTRPPENLLATPGTTGVIAADADAITTAQTLPTTSATQLCIPSPTS